MAGCRRDGKATGEVNIVHVSNARFLPILIYIIELYVLLLYVRQDFPYGSISASSRFSAYASPLFSSRSFGLRVLPSGKEPFRHPAN